MHSKIALFVASAFALGSLAAPGAPAPPPTVSECNVGQINCCNSVQHSSSDAVQGLLGALGLGANDVDGQVGVNCLDAAVVGASGTSCTAQPVCCTGNNFHGLIVVGCSPINVNL